MKKVEYVRKMLDILNDPSKFKRLGNCSECDNTGSLERSMQTLLLRLHKAGEISESTYKKIRPVGSTRPRMYGVAKVHKEDVPLRPILAMIGSPQHATAKWLAQVLEPVSTK